MVETSNSAKLWAIIKLQSKYQNNLSISDLDKEVSPKMGSTLKEKKFAHMI